ncbi:M20 family metallo-hydrolase [bacterium]|nr:M20 family metallo-hydrolase [bacterium]
MDEKTFSVIADRIDSYRDTVLPLQQGLTAIPALGPESGGDGEAEKSVYIESLLAELQWDSLEIIKAPDSRVSSGFRPNIIALRKGRRPGKTVWIMSHMDVVPAGDRSLWDTDPFTAVEKDGKIYGRGTEDNQQGLISSFLALKAFSDTGITPEYSVGLAIVADEENGSHFGIKYLLEQRPDIFSEHDIIIIPDAGDSEGVAIEVAEKSILWTKITVKGKMTHGSTPEKGINAHRAGAHLIVRLDSLYGLFDRREALYDPPVSTFEPTKKELNVENINTIPGLDVFCLDCRILPVYDLEEIKRAIRSCSDDIEKQFGVTVTIEYPQEESAPPPTPADTPAAEAIKKAVKSVTGRDAFTLGIGGGTVAACFRKEGLPAVCWCTLDDTLHGPNEYSDIANTLADAKVFAHIFLQE